MTFVRQLSMIAGGAAVSVLFKLPPTEQLILTGIFLIFGEVSWIVIILEKRR